MATLDILSEEDLKRISSFNLNSSYDLSDPRFGIYDECDICRHRKCCGHFATLDLGTYIVHPMFFRAVSEKMSKTCLECGNNVPMRRSKSHKCDSCSNIIDKDTPGLEELYNEDGDSLAIIKDLFDFKNFRERHFIIRKILVPPPGLRPKDDMEWPSDLSQAYSSLIRAIKGYKKDRSLAEYRTTITKYYSKIATGTSGSVIDGLLSGKDGIFRGILRGKRLDSSARSVITGDPNIHVDEVLIPKIISEKLVIGEMCFRHNVGELKKDSKNGRIFWNKKGDMVSEEEIVEGQKYYRCLRNGDLVLFNRQPSLSRESLMSFKVRIRTDDNLTISMNHIVASSFNADFDGDEMNIFADWSIQAQAELEFLCNVNMFHTLKPIQDTITGAYMMTQKDVILNGTIGMDCCTITGKSPRRCTTGIDLFMLSVPEGVVVNLKFPVKKDDICKKIPDIILSSTDDNKKVVRFYEDLQKIVCLWLGFNISIHDCMWTDEDNKKKDDMISLVDRDSYNTSQKDFFEWIYNKCLDDYGNTSLHKMIESGGKGNIINMSQIMASVGHQYISDDYGEKEKDNLTSMGFVKSSYMEGLDPDEFMIHLVASRTGVINTGVQTSSTGYTSRKASIIMADCTLDYMGIVHENDRIISIF